MVIGFEIGEGGHGGEGGGGGGVGAQVSRQVGEGFVPLVANARHQGNGAIGHRPHHPLIVKAVEILTGPAAPGQNYHLRPSILGHPFQGRHDGIRCTLPLDDGGGKDYLQTGMVLA